MATPRTGETGPGSADGTNSADERAALGRLGPKLVTGAVLAVVVASALALFGDVRELGSALRAFDWWLAVPILVLTCANYGLRFVKWELYLRRLDLPRPGLWTSLLVYLSAFSMSVTPGKVGELIKAVQLRRLTGAPVGRTTAVIAAERVTDGLAMLFLAGVGLTQFSYGRPLLAVALVVALGAVLLLQRPELMMAITGRLEGVPVAGGLVGHAGHFFGASNVLFRPGLVAGMTGLGVVSWFGECVAFFLVLVGLGESPSWELLLLATFVLAVSSVFGAISMLPGGLGVAEATVAGMLLLLDPDMSRGTAAAATLLIRFATLWFAVLVGFAALLLLQRQAGDGRREAAGIGGHQELGARS